MTEKIILKETITKGKPEVESKPKKKYYKHVRESIPHNLRENSFLRFFARYSRGHTN
jgi:hypothetical protein